MSGFTGPDHYQKFFDPKIYLETYFRLAGDSMGDDLLHFILKNLAQIFNSGNVKGETLIDIGTGPSIHHLLSACNAFKNIIVSDFTDRNREEFQAWLSNKSTIFDWSPILKHVCQLEGGRIPWAEKEDSLRRAVTQVLKCDILKSNPTDPVELGQADCVLSCLCLESVCKDEEDYIAALNNISTLLKPGGHLVLAGALGNTFYTVGAVRFSALPVTDDFIKQSLIAIGYDIISVELFQKPEGCVEDIADFTAHYVLLARKRA
ncbi:nicotinamide N-methyltransferase-like [Hyperolius riggenbachi]|uniref:nicotinamide N-methyltransferase-like n=1 Tax=Hyperolius riggenbachi TaxID=752182 RepID=UPI0035A34ECF